MKKIIVTLVLVLAGLFTGCSVNSTGEKKEVEVKKEEAKKEEAIKDNKIVIGVSPVPHGEILKNLKPEFEKVGLEVEIVEFDDYVQPNLQLESGDLDANYFQHKPYLDNFTKERGIKDLVSIGAVHLEPIGLYLKNTKSIQELKDGAEIIIPNDPTNGARALLLLQKNGLIKLDNPDSLEVTEKNIVENPKNFKFVAMDAPSIPKAFVDADAAVINSNYALQINLNPVEDSLLIEDKNSPNANLVVVKEKDKDSEKFKKFLEILQSENTKSFIENKYKGAVIPSF